jgi:peptidoglycan/LPS O-acetylase OafA/YrhL
MKRVYLIFIVAGLVLASTVLWVLSTDSAFRLMDLVQFGIVILIVAFAMYFGYKRLSSSRRGEPAEDEMSKKVMRKTAAWSYYVSLYAWLVIMYFSDKIKLETHAVIGMGILGMAVIFAVCWLVLNFTGIRNE